MEQSIDQVKGGVKFKDDYGRVWMATLCLPGEDRMTTSILARPTFQVSPPAHDDFTATEALFRFDWVMDHLVEE